MACVLPVFIDESSLSHICSLSLKVQPLLGLIMFEHQCLWRWWPPFLVVPLWSKTQRESEWLARGPQSLDAVNVCLWFEQILNTSVFMVNVSNCQRSFLFRRLMRWKKSARSQRRFCLLKWLLAVAEYHISRCSFEFCVSQWRQWSLSSHMEVLECNMLGGWSLLVPRSLDKNNLFVVCLRP